MRSAKTRTAAADRVAGPSAASRAAVQSDVRCWMTMPCLSLLGSGTAPLSPPEADSQYERAGSEPVTARFQVPMRPHEVDADVPGIAIDRQACGAAVRTVLPF